MANQSHQKGSVFGGLLLGIGIVGVYIVLQQWVLPAAGIPK